MRHVIGPYVFNLLIAHDQLLNAYLGGDPDETVSSRCAKRRDKPFWRNLAAFLEWMDPGHLDRSVEWDQAVRIALATLKVSSAKEAALARD